MKRVNVGCGMTPTLGWMNIDNSLSIKLSKYPILSSLLYRIGVLNRPQMDFISFCRINNIQWANVTKVIPLANCSVEVLYSSHMLEHLDRLEALRFLKEAKRVLANDGLIRLAVPDIRKKALSYIESNDADAFIASTHMCVPRPKSLLQRVLTLIVGTRHHQWMYDGNSLSKLLTEAGFSDPVVLPAGQTRINFTETLDLWEREDESVYVEAKK